MKKHIIVTGAYGMIGSHFCETIPKDWEVTKVKGMEISPFTEMADYIVHAAGYGQPQKFLEDEFATIEINTSMVLDLFNYYLKPNGTFLYLSTSEVYNGAIPPFSEDMIGITTPEHERACYIESKRCGEAICMAARRKGINAKVARVSLVYGEGWKKDDTRVMYQLIEQAINSKEITLLDSGSAKRTYCYIDDAVKMLWKILLDGKEPIYNLGGFSSTSILNLAMEIAKLLEVKLNIPKESVGLSGAPQDVRLDMKKVLNEFNLNEDNFISLEEGLKRIITWRKNEL